MLLFCRCNYHIFYVHLMMKPLCGLQTKTRFFARGGFSVGAGRKVWKGVGNTVVPVQCLVYDNDDNCGCPRTRVTRPGDVTNN